jgi:hypothetical protein
MTALARTTREQNIEEISVQLLDQLYYSGYVEEMSIIDPAKVEWELAQMESQFSKNN